MKNKTVRNIFLETVLDNLKDIRTRIISYQASVNKLIEQTYQKLEKKTDVFTETYLKGTLLPEIKASAQGDYSAQRDICLSYIRADFDAIQKAINDWVAQPVPESFSGLIGFIGSNNIVLNSVELEILRDSAQGSYFAQRLVAMNADRNGMVLSSDYTDLVTLSRRLKTVRSICESAVQNYYGVAEMGQPLKGAFLAENDVNTHLAFMAQDFINTDVLEEFEKTITASMAPRDSLSLTPSKQTEIDELFKGKSDEEKVSLVAKLLESDSRLDGVLQIYDGKLYQSGLDAIIKNSRARAEKAIADMEQAEQKALSTAQASARMSANAERRKMISAN